MSHGQAAHWLAERLGAAEDSDVQAFVEGLGALLDALELRALDLDGSTAEPFREGIHVALAHRSRGRIVYIEMIGDVIVSYGPEHEHFAWDDAEMGRVWPFEADDHIAQALSFIRYLVTGRIELDVWRRPFTLRTRSYWIAEDGRRELILRGDTIGPFFGWSRQPDIHTFDLTS